MEKLEKRFYRPGEFQKIFGIGKSKFYDEVSRGRIEIIKAGKASLIPRESVEAWIMLCREETRQVARGRRIARR